MSFSKPPLLSEIPVVILCGGKGLRIRDVADDIPKPLIRIGDHPIVWHIMKFYSHYGLRRFILCLGYKGYVLKEYFCNYDLYNRDVTVTLGNEMKLQYHNRHSEDGWEITLAETGLETMTGCRLYRVMKYIDTPVFMVSYADGLGDINIAQLYEFHLSHDGCATITGALPPPSRFGELDIEGDRIIRFTEKEPIHRSAYINGGYMVFNREFIQYLSDDESVMLERDCLSRCAEDGQLYVFRHDGFRQPMDTYKEWLFLNELWNRGEAPWKVWGD